MAFDLLIKSGTVVDGTGAPSYQADVAIAAGKIVEVGKRRVGMAPCKPDRQSQDVAAWDLVNLEAIPIEVLKTALTWDWETFPQYMDAAQRRGTAINLAFLAPLTPFRHFVMGPAALERAATAEETMQIKALLR